jgi:hypothetical protein
MANKGLSQLLQLTENAPHPAVNMSVQIIFAATNVPRRLPSIRIPAGAVIQIGGTTGKAANAQTAFASLYQDNLASNPTVVPPSNGPQDSVTFPVDNLNQIWVMGTAGDGIYASIRGSGVS